MKKDHIYLVRTAEGHLIMAVGRGYRSWMFRNRFRYDTEYGVRAYLDRQVFEIGKL